MPIEYGPLIFSILTKLLSAANVLLIQNINYDRIFTDSRVVSRLLKREDGGDRLGASHNLGESDISRVWSPLFC